MSTWFTENPIWAYWILGTLVIVCVVAFFSTKRVIYLGGVGLLIVLAIGLWLVDRYVVTDREQVELYTLEMAAAAEVGDIDGIGRNISSLYEGRGGGRDGLLAEARRRLPPSQTRRITIWNVKTVNSETEEAIICSCSAKATGLNEAAFDDQPIYLEFTYMKDSDGRWRVRRLRVMSAIGQQEINY